MTQKPANEPYAPRSHAETGLPRIRGPPTEEDVPRILYHGTCYRYLGVCGERYGDRIAGDIYLADIINEAMHVAVRRAQQYGGPPAVLVVDSTRLHTPPAKDRGCHWRTGRLPMDSFEYVVGSHTDQQAAWREWLHSIEYWSTAIPSLSAKQIARDNEDAFRGNH